MHGIKSILLPFNNVQPNPAAVDAAYRVATSFGSYIEGVYYRQLMPIIAGEGITLPGDYLAEFEAEGQSQGEEAARLFENLLQEHSIALGKLGDHAAGPRGGWVEMVGVGPAGIGEYARSFDLSVVARGADDLTVDWKTTVEAILFDSGRPLLIVSESIPEVVGRKIVVAWNGSVESARSLTAAMPFLARCEEAVVLAVRGGTVSGPDAAQAALHLTEHGIQVFAETIEKVDGSIGTAVLDYAKSSGADLLIKGAFTHSRIRQLIFGGATREILQDARLPVLFCH